MFKATIECAVQIKAVLPADLEHVIVDSTAQSKAIAHPVDSRLLKIARHKVVSAAKRASISLKQPDAQERKTLRRQAGGFTGAKQFNRLREAVNRLRKAISDLMRGLERAERIRTQQRNTKNKRYALHASEVDCVSNGKTRNPCEFGGKVSLAVTHKQGVMVGARSFPGYLYNGVVLSAQREQTTNLLQDLGSSPKQVIVDLGYRGVGTDHPGVQIIHRGKHQSLDDHEKRLRKRRQAIKLLIGHTQADQQMDRCRLQAAGCWLQSAGCRVQGAVGDALHAWCCAAGCNIRGLLRGIDRLGRGAIFCAWSAVVVCVVGLLGPLLTSLTAPVVTVRTARVRLPASTPLRLAPAV